MTDTLPRNTTWRPDAATEEQKAMIMALCGQIRLTRDERVELTEFVTGAENGSLRLITKRQATRLIDALTGHIAIMQLKALRCPR